MRKRYAVSPVVETSVPIVPPVDPANILTLPELAARLKVSERWCYEKTRSRSLTPLPCIRVGRYLRFDWLDVSAWLRQQSTVAANKRAA